MVTTTLKTDPADGLIVSQVDEFTVSGPELIAYQLPALRGLISPAAPSVEVLRGMCDLKTCKFVVSPQRLNYRGRPARLAVCKTALHVHWCGPNVCQLAKTESSAQQLRPPAAGPCTAALLRD